MPVGNWQKLAMGSFLSLFLAARMRSGDRPKGLQMHSEWL